MLARPSSGEEDVDGRPYQWSLKIEQQPVGELFAVRVQVDWPEPGGGSVELATWLNDYAAKAPEIEETTGRPNPNAANESPGR